MTRFNSHCDCHFHFTNLYSFILLYEMKYYPYIPGITVELTGLNSENTITDI